MNLNHKMARWVDRSTSSEFVVKGQALMKACPAGLCDMCARKPACGLRSANEVKRSCKQMMLPVAFVDKIGTDAYFNTMRLGSAWGRRLRANDVVSLTDKNGVAYGAARVERVVVCSKDVMLREHAHMNHTMLAKPPVDAPALLWHVVSKIYKNFMKTDDPEFTVIYLRRANARAN